MSFGPIPNIALSDHVDIPQIGLGVLRISNDATADVVETALSVGYRHIDTAAGYDNEQGVGLALQHAEYASGERRKQVFITTKLRDSEQGYDSTMRAFERQLKYLRTDYVDMYMIHWPTPFNWRSAETWKAFQELQQAGVVRTLGVCNFLPEHLDRLQAETGVLPTVNQIELHPTWQQREVVEYCKAHGIAVEAYSPMARGADLQAGHGVLDRIAERVGRSVAQVILRWHIQHGIIIIPKSTHRERQIENASLFDFELTAQDMAAIDALDSPHRAGHDPLTFSYA